jgi:hypothetical protein
MATPSIPDIVLRQMEKHNVTGSIEFRGKHMAIRLTFPDGRVRRLFCSLTPSDWRAPIKIRATLRRLLRSEMNIGDMA